MANWKLIRLSLLLVIRSHTIRPLCRLYATASSPCPRPCKFYRMLHYVQSMSAARRLQAGARCRGFSLPRNPPGTAISSDWVCQRTRSLRPIFADPPRKQLGNVYSHSSVHMLLSRPSPVTAGVCVGFVALHGLQHCSYSCTPLIHCLQAATRLAAERVLPGLPDGS